jgi:dUTP pyrophosphatase
MILQIKLLSKTARVPEYEHATDSGFDLRADIESEIWLYPTQYMLIKTGLAVAVPDGCELQIRPRSGTALKNGVSVLNSPGTVDAGYRNEIGVILHNTSERPFKIEPQQRIAQAVICPVIRAKFMVVTELPESDRGLGGFGSTGLK